MFISVVPGINQKRMEKCINAMHLNPYLKLKQCCRLLTVLHFYINAGTYINKTIPPIWYWYSLSLLSLSLLSLSLSLLLLPVLWPPSITDDSVSLSLSLRNKGNKIIKTAKKPTHLLHAWCIYKLFSNPIQVRCKNSLPSPYHDAASANFFLVQSNSLRKRHYFNWNK